MVAMLVGKGGGKKKLRSGGGSCGARGARRAGEVTCWVFSAGVAGIIVTKYTSWPEEMEEEEEEKGEGGGRRQCTGGKGGEPNSPRLAGAGL